MSSKMQLTLYKTLNMLYIIKRTGQDKDLEHVIHHLKN
jgi:hypothetical protein